MYQSQTFETILNRMISRVTASHPNVDTREGSIIYNALAPAAVELAVMYTELDNTRSESFVETATREYKLLGCKQIGIDIQMFNAHPGIYRGEFDVEIDIGSRWNHDRFNYVVEEYIGTNADGRHEYKMACETAGSEPNAYMGKLTPISDYPTNLSHAAIIGVIVEGEDETPDEEITEVYYNAVNGTDRDGNIAQYKTWCDQYDGIGNYKIFPLWNGANTVKISILSASNRAATPELVAEFQKYIDPNAEGMGNGQAPIGAFVTATTAAEVPMNISATITLKTGYSTAEGVDEALDALFSSIAYEDTQVNYMMVGATILGCESVANVSNMTINGGTSDITLTAEQIPVRGTTAWKVTT